MQDKELYQTILGLSTPWQVANVELDVLITSALFFNPISRWALAPVLQLLAIRREPGLAPFG